ncbi:MAG: class II fructose-bisphosphate aldolase [Patescibacteria group bacterium]
MKTLREAVQEAKEKNVAIGHFNISNLEGLHAVYNAAKKLDVPVIIGLSEGEEDFVGANEAVALIQKIRETDQYPIYLNADHHYSFERVKDAIDAGFDAVIIDAADKSFEENVALTKQCVEYACASGRDVLVEAELGYIGSGSSIKESIPEGAGIKTKPEEAKRFVEQTGIDMLAPSVGSIHGLIKSGKPHIIPELVKEISTAVHIPLVLHGGSGLRDEDFINGIQAGISIVHINTEIRVAFTEAIKKFMAENPNETTPYKIMQSGADAIEKIVEDRLRLFNKIA